MLTDDVYEVVKQQIMDCQLPPADRINVDELARQLEVSITPVREALARLESEGLVTKMAMRGFFATPLLDEKHFEDIYQLRLLTEPWACGAAAETLTTAQLDSLLESCHSIGVPTARLDYDSYRALMAHDAAFHQAIHEAAGNTVVTHSLNRLHCHLHLFRLRYTSTTGSATIAEHLTIVEALASRDPATASTAMSHHLQAARARLREQFTDRNEES